MEKKVYKKPLIVGTMRLGKWGANFNTKEYEYFIDQCLDHGLNEFDHADIYGHYSTEEEFGQVLKIRPELKNKIKITTKCGIKMISPNRPHHLIKSYDSSSEHIRNSVEQSLKYLNVENIEVLLLHRPDYLMNIDEVAFTFGELKKEGKVNHFGVSNFSVDQFDLLNKVYPLVTNQVELSLINNSILDSGVLDQCQSNRIQASAWSPLGGGAIFGESTELKTIRLKKALNEMADKKNCNASQLLLAWIKKIPSGVIPVLGTSKIGRIIEALKADRIDLSKEEWYKLLEASRGKEVA